MSKTPQSLQQLVDGFIADESLKKAIQNQPKEGAGDVKTPEQLYTELEATNRHLIEIVTGYSCPSCWGSGQSMVEGQFQYCPVRGCEASIRLRRDNLLKILNQFGDVPDIYSQFTFDSWVKNVHPSRRKDKELAVYCLEYLVNFGGDEFALADVFDSEIVKRRLTGVDYSVRVIEPDLNSKKQSDHDPRVAININGSDGIYFNSIGHSVVLASQTKGMGKTGLAVAATKHLIDDGVAVAFVHLPSLLRDTRKSYGNDAVKSYDDLMLPIERADVLIVDDFNVPYDPTRNDMRVIEDEIIQRRWSENKPMILTTNHSQSSFTEQWGERASSRVFEMAHWVELRGQVVRRQNKPVS